MTPQTLETLAAENQRLRNGIEEALSCYASGHPRAPAHAWSIIAHLLDEDDNKVECEACGKLSGDAAMHMDGNWFCKECEAEMQKEDSEPSPAPQPVVCDHRTILDNGFCKQCGIHWNSIFPRSPSESSAPVVQESLSAELYPSFESYFESYFGKLEENIGRVIDHKRTWNMAIKTLTAERDALIGRPDITRDEFEWMIITMNAFAYSMKEDEYRKLMKIRAKNPPPTVEAK